MADQIDNSNTFEGEEKRDGVEWKLFPKTPPRPPRRSNLLFGRREPKKQWKLKKWIRIVLVLLPLMGILGYIIFDGKSGGAIKSEETSPKIVPKKKTSLFVTATPGANVYLNGELRGNAPLKNAPLKIEDLAVGKYKLELKNPDFADSLVTEFTWPQDKDDTMSYAFQTPKMSSLEVITDPETRVYIDKELRGDISPLLIQNLAPGRHLIQLKKSDIWGNWTTETTLKPGKRGRLEYHWNTGSLSVNAEPYGIVFIDARKTEETPLLIETIAVGKHKLRVVREGIPEDYNDEIVIVKGETTEISIGN